LTINDSLKKEEQLVQRWHLTAASTTPPLAAGRTRANRPTNKHQTGDRARRRL